MKKQATSVIGSGISGMIAAAWLAKNGYAVDVFEKNVHHGGRIRSMHHEGFVFDMGPSWYWMPDVIDEHFEMFGHRAVDFFELVRLDPAYKVFWDDEPPLVVPADLRELVDWMERREPGSRRKLEAFLAEAETKYRMGMGEFARRPMQRWKDFFDTNLLRGASRLDLCTSMHRHIRRYFRDPKIIQFLSFPVLFLGGTSHQIPALYSLMNYADLNLGTWYPMGGMYKLSEAWYSIANAFGVRFHFNAEVREIRMEGNRVVGLRTKDGVHETAGVVAACDYHHVEQRLIPHAFRQHTKKYWSNRVLAPSCLLFYVGVDRRFPGLLHHNLFFDEDLEVHSDSIYVRPRWPEKPLFYVCCPSKTDESVSPGGFENLFVLIPVAPGLAETEDLKDTYFNIVVDRLEHHLGMAVRPHILFKHSFGIGDFERDYNSFKGNAYGLASTLRQTAILRPSMQHRKISNMVYAGHMTVPGPGIPPSMISGRMAADLLSKLVA